MEIVVYGTPTCSVCKQAKEWLNERGQAYEYVDLLEAAKADAIGTANLVKESGMRTVPIVKIDGYYIGGFDALQSFFVEE